MSAHLYWRLNILSNYGAAATTVTEFYLYDVEGNLVTVLGTGTATASTTQSPTTPSQAFDANTSTQWQSTAAAGWLKWTANAPVDVGTAGIRNYNANATFFPQSVQVQWSDNNVDWTTHVAFTNPNTLSATTYAAPPTTGDADLTAPATFVTSSVGYGGGNAALYQRIELAGYGGGSASIEAPGATTIGYSGGAAALEAPAATLSAAAAGRADLTMPAMTAFGTGGPTDNGAALTMPSPSLSAQAGGNAGLTMPAATAEITGTVTNFGAAAMSCPIGVVDGDGTTSATGGGRPSLRMPAATVVGYAGAVLAVTIDGATVAATGTTGAIGDAALTLPLFELAADGTTQNYGSAALVMPSPRIDTGAVAWLLAPSARLTAIGSAVVAVTYEAYSVNLAAPPPRGRFEEEATFATTHYTNYPFDHIVRYQNSYFGVNSTGLYLLEGTTDFADPTPTEIPWSFKTGTDDFKTPLKKTVASAYFAGRLAPLATISLYAGEAAATEYAYSTPRGALAQNHRQKFGRGIKSRYFAIGAAGEGGPLLLDAIEPEIYKMTRSI